MRIHFWGVRGSIPSPLSPSQIENRIAAIVQRITPRDIETPDSRQRFISALPQWLNGTVGGNTSCIEVETSSGDTILLDAGSGIREYGLFEAARLRSCRDNGGRTYHIFLSHFHWDHIQGLPFFPQAYNPANRLCFYSTNPDMENLLYEQMKAPFFPVPMSFFNASLEFHHLSAENDSIRIGSARIAWRKVNHPGGCTSFSITDEGKKCIYATDTELAQEDFHRTEENCAFFGKADMLIIDAQYTMSEALEKSGWGHSYFSLSVDFAATWNIRKLFLFHHEPTYTDKKIYSLRQSAQWYLDYVGNSVPEILVAREGEDVYL